MGVSMRSKQHRESRKQGAAQCQRERIAREQPDGEEADVGWGAIKYRGIHFKERVLLQRQVQ